MDHNFNVQIAVDFDLETAVFLNNMAFWTNHNVANNKHYLDGHYWTYNSIPAFSVLFPYWSTKQVERLLNKLTKSGLLLKGNYNLKKYDKTCWYALTNSALCYFPALKSSITRASTHLPKSGDGSPEIGRPIPDSKLQIEKDIISDIVETYHEELPELPTIRTVDSKLKGQLTKMVKQWPNYQNEGKEFTISSFKDYLNCIKVHYAWLIKPYTTVNGNIKLNNLRVLTREINIAKIVNGEFSAT